MKVNLTRTTEERSEKIEYSGEHDGYTITATFNKSDGLWAGKIERDGVNLEYRKTQGFMSFMELADTFKQYLGVDADIVESK